MSGFHRVGFFRYGDTEFSGGSGSLLWRSYGGRLMIFGEVTKYAAGITLYGHYSDLTHLYQTVADISEGSPFGEYMLGLVYEIRHSYQGDREIYTPPEIFEPRGSVYLGFKQLWPVFLIQLGMLRSMAGYQPTSKDQQADLFRLEACAEHLLTSYDPFIGKRCVQWLSLFPGLGKEYRLQVVEEGTLQYVAGKARGKARFKKLPEILKMFSPFSKEYREFNEHLQQCAKEQNCTVDDLYDPAPWPDFKW